MSDLIVIAGNIVAICVLALGVYFPRHHRRDLVVAYLGVNIGVLVVSSVLTTAATASIGVGLGLFGVLSIIRLRSDELAQHEVAYYFSALSIGLVAGLRTTSEGWTLALMAIVVIAMYLGDHPRLFGSYGRELVQLDRAVVDTSQLRADLSDRLGVDVRSVSVQKLDLANDTTLVDVRYRRRPASTTTPSAAVDAHPRPSEVGLR